MTGEKLLVAWGDFAEILPRFISKPMSHKAHKRILSDRDPLFYWPFALHKAGAGTSLGFITPRSGVRSSPRYQFSNSLRQVSISLNGPNCQFPTFSELLLSAFECGFAIAENDSS
ncbi:hypothetical protein BH18ACI4_BH18ACI4_27810 [soil metagenome]